MEKSNLYEEEQFDEKRPHRMPDQCVLAFAFDAAQHFADKRFVCVNRFQSPSEKEGEPPLSAVDSDSNSSLSAEELRLQTSLDRMIASLQELTSRIQHASKQQLKARLHGPNGGHSKLPPESADSKSSPKSHKTDIGAGATAANLNATGSVNGIQNTKKCGHVHR